MVTRPLEMRNTVRSAVVSRGAALVAAVLAAGCGTTVESTAYRIPEAANVEYVQVATDADFGRYDRLIAEPLGIFFPRGVTLPDEDNRRIRQIFRKAFLAELEGYQLIGEPGPDAMAVQASLIDMRSSEGVMPQLRRGIDELAQPGKIVFLMEMRDSESGRTLARAADSASAPAFATDAGMETDWASVDAAAKRWAELFRRFLDDNLSE